MTNEDPALNQARQQSLAQIGAHLAELGIAPAERALTWRWLLGDRSAWDLTADEWAHLVDHMAAISTTDELLSILGDSQTWQQPPVVAQRSQMAGAPMDPARPRP